MRQVKKRTFSFYCRRCGTPTDCKIIKKYYHRLAIKVIAKCKRCDGVFDGLIPKPCAVVTKIKTVRQL